ncbi:DNA-binding domain-containing protein [Novilysobacter arseniciresistens]|uniref:HvfC family RiPP maturation protein n=1 Tax=Novilysobacter arseniciresistens TaxID=1385522 RepID=UPI0009DCC272|nr:putative DNA-binding domain-containing protein [Lysobacter arseniciresistens]
MPPEADRPGAPSPESPRHASTPDAFADTQRALADYIRDPDHAPAPEGIEPRRLRVYRELFFNNMESMLGGNFPVIRRILSAAPDAGRWSTFVRDFYREHPVRTPLFPEIAREFLRYVEGRADNARGDPPWLAELAHYEWVELALQISEARIGDIAHDPHGDLLAGAPLVSPLAWPLAYAWPVHRIGPGFLPDAPPAEATCLLLTRDDDGTVRFRQLSALTFRLLQRLDQHPELDGRSQLQALATEAAAPSIDAFIDEGRRTLAELRRDGIVLGTRSGAAIPVC